MMSSLIILILVSFMLLLFTCLGVIGAIAFFIGFRTHIRLLYTEYLWVIFGLAWIGIVVSTFLEVALSLGIIASSIVDINAVDMSLTISFAAVTISGAVGGLIYKFRKRIA